MAARVRGDGVAVPWGDTEPASEHIAPAPEKQFLSLLARDVPLDGAINYMQLLYPLIQAASPCACACLTWWLTWLYVTRSVCVHVVCVHSPSSTHVVHALVSR